MEILKTILPNELARFRLDFDDDMKLSLNKVWSGGQGTQWIRKKAADLWHGDISQLLDSGKKMKVITEKVDLFMTFYFSTGDSGGKRQLDSSNCSALGKLIEDAMKYDKTKNPKGIIVDDTNDKVGWFCLKSAQMTLAERKALASSFVEVSIRTHSKEI